MGNFHGVQICGFCRLTCYSKNKLRKLESTYRGVVKVASNTKIETTKISSGGSVGFSMKISRYMVAGADDSHLHSASCPPFQSIIFPHSIRAILCIMNAIVVTV